MVRAALGMVSVLLAFGLVVSVYWPASASAPSVPQRSTKVTGRSRHGQAHVLRSVHVAGVLSLAVVQQPPSDEAFISTAGDAATQFARPSRYGNIALLAHNYLAGRSFSRLAIGETVHLIYGDGSVDDFVITEVLRFQALQPNNSSSGLRDLDSNALLTARQVFARVYGGKYHLTFQTCIEKAGNQSWGRLFVLAIPAAEYGSGQGPKR
jgi:hypothetical protein